MAGSWKDDKGNYHEKPVAVITDFTLADFDDDTDDEGATSLGEVDAIRALNGDLY